MLLQLILYFILFILVAPEIYLFILIVFSSEDRVFSNVPKSKIDWLDDLLVSINKFFVDLPTQEKTLWILLGVIIYFILLSLIRYKDIHILFILSNMFVIYFMYTMIVVDFLKLNVAWSIIITTVLSLSVVGIRMTIFEKIKDFRDSVIDILDDIIFKIKSPTISNNYNEYNYEKKENNDNNFYYGNNYNREDKENYYNNFDYRTHNDNIYSTIKNPYKILGVSEQDDIETIKKVYRALSKTYHPDINNSSLSNEKFIEINEAWEKIISKERSNQ